MRFPSEEIVETLRRDFPAGATVELIAMNDQQAPPIGTKGRVLGVDDVGTIHVAWQTGGSLGIAYGEDSCRRVE